MSVSFTGVSFSGEMSLDGGTPKTVEILAVGGGGGTADTTTASGYNVGQGGGGGAQVLFASANIESGMPYVITVAAGGGAFASPSPNTIGSAGSNTSISGPTISVTSYGGGGGGSRKSLPVGAFPGGTGFNGGGGANGTLGPIASPGGPTIGGQAVYANPYGSGYPGGDGWENPSAGPPGYPQNYDVLNQTNGGGGGPQGAGEPARTRINYNNPVVFRNTLDVNTMNRGGGGTHIPTDWGGGPTTYFANGGSGGFMVNSNVPNWPFIQAGTYGSNTGSKVTGISSFPAPWASPVAIQYATSFGAGAAGAYGANNIGAPYSLTNAAGANGFVALRVPATQKPAVVVVGANTNPILVNGNLLYQFTSSGYIIF